MANFAKICKRDELKFGKGSTLGENSWKGVRKQPGIKGDIALKIIFWYPKFYKYNPHWLAYKLWVLLLNFDWVVTTKGVYSNFNLRKE